MDILREDLLLERYIRISVVTLGEWVRDQAEKGFYFSSYVILLQLIFFAIYRFTFEVEYKLNFLENLIICCI